MPLLVLIGLLIYFSFASHFDGAVIASSTNGNLESNFQVTKQYTDDSKITIIFTLYSLNRVDFCINVLKKYSTYPYSELIANIVVIWNNVYMALPTELSILENIINVKGEINSLNNRYILPIPIVSTTAVLMHDDDMLVTIDGLQCLYEVWKKNQDRIVSRYVRQLSFNNSEVAYIYDELYNSSVTYHFGIRLMMFSTKYLQLYASTMNQKMQDYVTFGPGKCDDIAFNMITTLHSHLPPLRAMLPPSSVLSFDRCGLSLRGIGSVSDRQNIRSVCTKGLLEFFPNPQDVLASTKELAYCPISEKVDRQNDFINKTTFTKVEISCKDMPKYINTQLIEKVFSIEATSPNNLLPIPSVVSASLKTFRLGIIAMEFWSVEMDGRKGGFGYAAFMASLALRSSIDAVSVFFLHATKVFVESGKTCTDSLVELHSRPVLLLRKDEKCYKKLLDRLQLDAVMTIEFRQSYMTVLKYIKNVPVIVWVHDPHTPDIATKIRNNLIPIFNGTSLPVSVSPTSGSVKDSLKYHNKVIFAVTVQSFIPQYPLAYSFAPLQGYLTPQLPYAMDAFSGTNEMPLPMNPNPTPRVICIGRLDPVKRPWLFAEVARRLPHIEFILLGRLFASANGLGFGFSEETRQPSNLILAGHLEGQKKKELIASAWLLVSTTIHEGFPFNFVEALQVGIPIVATHDPDGITSKFGIFVGNHPANSGFDAVPKLKEAIEKLIGDSTLRRKLGAAGKAWVAEHHSVKSFNRAFQTIQLMVAGNHFAPLATARKVDQLAICAMFLNEDDTIVEWIEYHLMLGVSKILLYHLDNHASRSQWRRILWPYVEKGQVKVHASTVTYLGQWSNRQAASLQQCYDTYRHDYKWLAFIDVDEFLVPRDPSTSLPALLRRYSDESGLVIPWRTFGPTTNFDRSRGKLPRITEATKATEYDQRGGLIVELGGNVKVIVNTHHTAADHCYFTQNGGIHNSKRFMHFSHNCLYNAPTPPVDEHFKAVPSPWALPFPATSDIIQLNHYFARTCNHFFGQRRNSRLASIRARYGDNIPGYYKSRLGIGLGKTKKESCAAMQSFFNTTDTLITTLGNQLWTKLESTSTEFASKKTTLPTRGSCKGCLPTAYCIDVLQKDGISGRKQAECVCHEPLIGDGRTFCGNVTWATGVETNDEGDFSYLLGAPDGDRYAAHWEKDPRSSFYKIYFNPSGQLFSNVRMAVIYQPLDPVQVVGITYVTSGIMGNDATDIRLDSGLIQGKNIPSFLKIPLNSVELSSLEIRFDDPIALGGVGIVIG